MDAQPESRETQFPAREEKSQEKSGTSPAANIKAGDPLEFTLKDVKWRFHWCPAGTFIMGSPESEKGRRDDETQHKVTLTKGFWMGETEVTQEMWQAVMGNNPSNFKGVKHPVEQVSWYDCQEFVKKLNESLAAASAAGDACQ
jgi:formylglycine-generating enzyme required for sulfatase activity